MSYKSRAAVPDEYKWDLSKIFVSDEAWEIEFRAVNELISAMEQYRGTLAEQGMLLECFKHKDQLSMRFEKLYVYVNMKSHEDIRISKYQEMCSRIELASSEFAAKVSYIVPEIIASYTAAQLTVLSQDSAFSDYSYRLTELARRKERVLSDKEEIILARTGVIVEAFSSAFSKFDNVDVRWDDVKDSKGKTHSLTHGTYALIMQSKDRKLRKNAHYSMFGGYKAVINVLSANYTGSLQSDIFYAKARGYKDSLEHALDGENIPREIYDKLIIEVNKALPLMKKYLAYRRKKLGVSRHKAYDMYVNTERKKELRFQFSEAFAKVVEGLRPLGTNYLALLEKARQERWIDVFETEGKRSGGYSWGAYTTPPYILLNYNGTLRETFTIAHELGHSLHSCLSDASQPYAKAQYEIFVAEIASTVNEMLLIRHMQKTADSALKRYLSTYLLDMFKGTVFRQCLFAEFEREAHAGLERGEGLSSDILCSLYENLNKKYYGNGYITDVLKYEWARIPHFYNAYYVYKYATGLIAATAISESIFNGETGAVERYIEFLSSGGSKPPDEILKAAGVDLTSDIPYRKAFKLFSDTLKELIML